MFLWHCTSRRTGSKKIVMNKYVAATLSIAIAIGPASALDAGLGGNAGGVGAGAGVGVGGGRRFRGRGRERPRGWRSKPSRAIGRHGHRSTERKRRGSWTLSTGSAGAGSLGAGTGQARQPMAAPPAPPLRGSAGGSTARLGRRLRLAGRQAVRLAGRRAVRLRGSATGSTGGSSCG